MASAIVRPGLLPPIVSVLPAFIAHNSRDTSASSAPDIADFSSPTLRNAHESCACQPAALVLNEQRWLPQLAPRLPLKIPTPLRVGVAQGWYPWSWSVVPWMEGTTADLAPPDDDQAEVLGGFFEALHRAAPAEAPLNQRSSAPQTTPSPASVCRRIRFCNCSRM